MYKSIIKNDGIPLVSHAAEDYVEGRSYVSLPEIMKDLDLSYPMAKAFIEKLREEKLVRGEFEGMKLKVNRIFTYSKSVGKTEALCIRARMRINDVSLLKSFVNPAIASIPYKKRYAHLMELGLIVEDDGYLYTTIDQPSVDSICGMNLDSEEWFEAVAAREIAAAIRSRGIDLKSVNITFIPENIMNLAEDILAEGEEISVPEWDGEYHMAKYAFIEAFLRKTEEETLAAYRENAKRQLEALGELGLTSGKVYDAVELCLIEIMDLTLDNIKEIKRMIDDD